MSCWFKEVSQLTHEHDLVVQSLKQKMVAMRNEHSLNSHQSTTSADMLGGDNAAVSATKQQYDAVLQNIRGQLLGFSCAPFVKVVSIILHF